MTEVAVRSRGLRGVVRIPVWAPAGTAARTRLPLLVAHDGREYERVSRLTRFAAAMVALGRLPPHRVALLSPGPDRAELYSASARYARALTGELVPALRHAVGVDGAPVGLGASLGALALLHAEHRAPGTFAGLFLQSGSFFTRRLDPQEAGFARFRRIARFVAAARREAGGLPRIVLTCGAEEENLANNRALADALGLELHVVPGGHDHLAWRDALDPHLSDLLAATWRG